MMYYYYQGQYYCSGEAGLPLPPCQEPPPHQPAPIFLVSRPPQSGRASFAVSAPGQLTQQREGPHWLDLRQLPPPGKPPGLPPSIERLIRERRLRAVNFQHPRWRELAAAGSPSPLGGGKRVHVLALGDVGATLALGLRLLGAGQVDSIGVYDTNEQLCKRWEFELNQVEPPCGAEAPPLTIITQEQLFNCDVFVFCATAGLPPPGQAVDDVRLYQLHGNTELIGIYARQARAAGFNGLFAVVSDPVDLLCRAALRESNRDANGSFDGRGLRPEQIQGYGLGVMQARAAYYARREQRFASFLTEGRAFGPHGQGLVIANSLTRYDDALSRELTELALNANLQLRGLGYKPYVAPAISSAAVPLLATLAGEWHYSCTCLGEIYMGARNRFTAAGLEVETLDLPPLLYERIQQTADELEIRG
jgi:hypothetical protein